MPRSSRPPAGHTGYATGAVIKVPPWHGLVVWDVLFNNLSTGLFLVAAACELAQPEVFTTVAQAAYPVALVLLLVDLLLLVLDLGDPWRFHHMLRVFKPSSPMSFGTWSLNVYALSLTAAVVFQVLPLRAPMFDVARKLAVVGTILPAFCSCIYKGVLFSTSSQPGWRDARWLGGYLTSSAVLLGCAEMLLLSILLHETNATTVLRPTLLLLILLNLIPFALLVASVREALARRYLPGQLRLLGMLSLGPAVIIPLCLLPAGDNRGVLLGAVLFLLLGSLVIRWVIVQIPHGPPHSGETRR
jgi:Ni/Fe-hydrogenase subunit HybB-like protein